MITENAGKWVKIGVSKKDRDKIRERVRSKAKHILSSNHKHEFRQIKKRLMEEEFNFYSDIVKGGLK